MGGVALSPAALVMPVVGVGSAPRAKASVDFHTALRHMAMFLGPQIAKGCESLRSLRFVSTLAAAASIPLPLLGVRTRMHKANCL